MSRPSMRAPRRCGWAVRAWGPRATSGASVSSPRRCSRGPPSSTRATRRSRGSRALCVRRCGV
eukprot:217099-Lingulodinium_polyedra.AAC.1